MAAQDIQNGEGMAFIDPHGKTADLLLEYVPKERIRDVVYIAPFDTEFPISFNVLESVDEDKKHLVVSGLMSTFKKIWVDAWSARMEYILTNTLLALLDYPGATLLGVNKMLSDKAYRNEVVASIKDPSVKSFWVKEFANYTERMAAEAVPSIQNKVGQFTANPLIRNMIGQATSSFDIRKCMDERKILIINLSKGKIGDENMKLLGGLLVTKIYLAAMSRADVPDRVMKMLPNFYLFVDEFQNFANASFADILSEARKYKLNLTIAHQYVEQMDEFVRAAVFGNVGTMMVFRVGATDAELLEKEFSPDFTMEDLVNLGFTQIYLKLMIDGLTSPPFSAVTLPPIAHPDVSYVKEIIDASREQFAKSRTEVEEFIVKFHEDAKKIPNTNKNDTNPRINTNDTNKKAGEQIQPKPPMTEEEKKLKYPEKKDYSSKSSSTPVQNSVPAPKSISPSTTSPIAPVSEPIFTSPTITPMSSAVDSNKPVSMMPRAPKEEKTHKPFAVLGSALKQKETIAVQKPVTSPERASAPVPAYVPAQHVSLSNLTSTSRKVDPKQPTSGNVNALKSALANILKKEAPKPEATKPEAQKSEPSKGEAPKFEAPKIDDLKPEVPKEKTQPTVQKNALKPIQKITSASDEPAPYEQENPKEVPEDVLKKVLE